MTISRARLFKIREIEFCQFCDVRNLRVMEFSYSPKNMNHYLGHAMTADGFDQYYLITENANYYQRESSKKWDKIDYVLKKGEESDVCSET